MNLGQLKLLGLVALFIALVAGSVIVEQASSNSSYQRGFRDGQDKPKEHITNIYHWCVTTNIAVLSYTNVNGIVVSNITRVKIIQPYE